MNNTRLHCQQGSACSAKRTLGLTWRVHLHLRQGQVMVITLQLNAHVAARCVHWRSNELLPKRLSEARLPLCLGAQLMQGE